MTLRELRDRLVSIPENDPALDEAAMFGNLDWDENDHPCSIENQEEIDEVTRVPIDYSWSTPNTESPFIWVLHP